MSKSLIKQRSDWSHKSIQLKKTDHNHSKIYSILKSSFYQGFILGCFSAGLILSILISLWLTSPTKTTTYISSSLSFIQSTSSTTKTTSTSSSSTTTSASTTSTTSTTSTSTTTSFPIRWNSSGITILGTVGTYGSTSNQLFNPYGLKFYSLSNSLYITDNNNHRIQKYSISNSVVTTVAGQNSGYGGNLNNQFKNPKDCLLDSNDNLYITDTGNHRVQLWNNGANYGTTFAGSGIQGNATNELNNPYGIVRHSITGTIYVADQGNHRIMGYSSSSGVGTIIAGGNGRGYNSNQLNFPTGLYLDQSTNSLIIANWGANNIVRWIIGQSNWTIVVGSQNGISGTTSTLLDHPIHALLDSLGNVYVADTYNHRIQFVLAGQSNGITIAGMTQLPGNTSTLLNMPGWLALDNLLNIYVTDTANHRLQKFPRY